MLVSSLAIDEATKALYGCFGYASSISFQAPSKMGLIKSMSPYTNWTVLKPPAVWGVLAYCKSLAAHNDVVLAGMVGYRMPSYNIAEVDKEAGLWRSENGGRSWKRLGPRQGVPDKARVIALSCLSDLSSCYMVLNPLYLGMPLKNRIYHGRNLGASWAAIDYKLPKNERALYGRAYIHATRMGPRRRGSESVAIMLINSDRKTFRDEPNEFPQIFFSGNGVAGPFKLLPVPGAWETFYNLTAKNYTDRKYFASIFPGGQQAVHGSIVVDHLRPGMVYVGGDRIAGPGDGGPEGEGAEIEPEDSEVQLRRRRLRRRGVQDNFDLPPLRGSRRPPVLPISGDSGSDEVASGRLSEVDFCESGNYQIGGNQTVYNSYGAIGWSASVYRISAETKRYLPMLGKKFSVDNTAPHADTRGMFVDAAGNLIILTDGGIFKRENPDRIGIWRSLLGTGMGNVECHDAIYEPVTDRFACATQDAGNALTSPGNQRGPAGERRWYQVTSGDGGPIDVGPPIDPKFGPQWIFSLYYFMHVSVYNDPTTNRPPKGARCRTFTNQIPQAEFYQRFSRNRFNDSRFLVAVQESMAIYESQNGLVTFKEVGAQPVSLMLNATWATETIYLPIHAGTIFGGMADGVAKQDVWWAWTLNALQLHDDSVFAGSAVLVDHPFANPMGRITGVVVDPLDYRRVCISGGGPPVDRILCSLDGKLRKVTVAQAQVPNLAPVVSWTDVSGNFVNLTSSFGTFELSQVLSLIWIRPIRNREFLVASTPSGIVYMDLAVTGTWKRLDAGLPPIVVSRIKYYPESDMLIAATLGRGVWSLRNFSTLLI